MTNKNNYILKNLDEFITINQNKLIIDIIYSLSRKNYSNFNTVRVSSNNKLPTKDINKLKEYGLLVEYKPTKAEKKAELDRNGVGLYHLSKMKFYSLTDDLKDLLGKSYKLFRKIKQACINRFAKRRIKKFEKQQDKLRQETQEQDFINLREGVLSSYSIREVLHNPNHLIECIKNGVNNISDFLAYDLQTIKMMLGFTSGDVRLIRHKIGKLLTEDFGFINGDEL